MDDADFIQACYHGSYRLLVGQLVGLTGSLADAEEVVQEAFVRALAQPAVFRKCDNPEAWLRTVAVNLTRSRWARLKRWSGRAPEARRPLDAHELTTDRLALLQALRTLPSVQREAIALHHIADLPVNEVAALLGVAPGTVKARLSRGRARLAEALSETAAESTTSEAHHA